MFLNPIQCTYDSMSNFTEDANKIMTAIESDSLWSDQIIIDILVARSNDERQEIQKAFKRQFRMVIKYTRINKK